MVAEGETVAVGEVIARIGGAAGEHLVEEARAGAQVVTPTAGNGAPAEPSMPSQPAPSTEDAVTQAPGQPKPFGDQPGSKLATRATPLARRIAADHGVALAAVTGSGPRGRITKGDVLAAAGVALEEARRPSQSPVKSSGDPGVASSSPAAAAKGAIRVENLSRIQALVARRMAEAKATVPEFQVQTEVDMGAALELRAQLKRPGDERSVVSVNDMIVKACALALTKHPRANGSYRDGSFLLHERVNVGFAVVTDDALIVPTLSDADAKPLGQIAQESRRLAQRVRNGEITPHELAGATFTVSNLGMFRMTAITPVINPPQAAILGVGATRTVLTRDEEGEIRDASMLTLTLSCDHRILYGADAARVLAAIKELLEAPLRLML